MPESGEPTGVLLDTHVWVWLMEGDASHLSESVIDALEAASNRGALAVSAISVWEVAMLEAKGRLRLSRPIDEWVRAALEARGTRLMPLTPGIAIESARLPGNAPGDPADRILMASARIEGIQLATRDRAILKYGRTGHLAVLNAR
jgi:PIN domain nuclease of toxin-antitoxin system